MSLVYDYRTGDIIDASTGEVVGRIYLASIVDGFERGNLVTTIDRVHYEVRRPLRFKAIDPVARQLHELRLRLSFPYTARMLQNRYSSTREARLERKLLTAWNLAMNTARSLGLEIDEAAIARIVRDAHNLAPRLSAKALAMIAVYVACRALGTRLDIEEIVELVEPGLPSEKRARVARKVALVARSLVARYANDRKVEVARIVDAVTEKLGKPDLAIVAKVLLRRVDISGWKAHCVAAALIYLASLLRGCDVGLKRVSELAKCSETTIRIRYRAVAERLGIEIARYGSCGPVKRIDVPEGLCRELEPLELASYVRCG